MYYHNNKIFLSQDDNGLLEDKNKLEYDGKVYFLKYLDEEFKSSKGGNSSVFILYNGDDDDEKVVKISNFPRPKRTSSKKAIRRHGRFINEIKALYTLQDDDYLSNYVMNIYFDHEIVLENRAYPYYVTDKADSDLKEYLLKNKNVLDDQEKIKLCYDVFMAIKKLHLHDFYHRDIKPDNVFLFKDDDSYMWKIGDLGLIAERDKDYDDLGERIGPFGWISPEAMNKYLTEKYSLEFDCKIDDKSDVFQLGYLFWFVFNQNAPIGIICKNDFILKKNKELFDLIFIMLTYSKSNRFSLDDVQEFLFPICQNYGII